jgi:hypothetical protein
MSGLREHLMSNGGESSRGGRVVLLSRDSTVVNSVLAELPGGVTAVRAETPYEAAAELLAEPADALVLDLRLMAPRHVGLLEIARRRGAPVLAVAALPAAMSAEQLDGVRLIARDRLGSAVAELAAAHREAAAATAEPPAAARPAPPAPSTGEGDEEPPAAELLTPEELSALLEDEP